MKRGWNFSQLWNPFTLILVLAWNFFCTNQCLMLINFPIQTDLFQYTKLSRSMRTKSLPKYWKNVWNFKCLHFLTFWQINFYIHQKLEEYFRTTIKLFEKCFCNFYSFFPLSLFRRKGKLDEMENSHFFVYLYPKKSLQNCLPWSAWGMEIYKVHTFLYLHFLSISVSRPKIKSLNNC